MATSPSSSPGDSDSQILRSLLLSCSSTEPDSIPPACIAVESLLRPQSTEHARDFYRLCFPVLLQKIFGFEDCHSVPHPGSSASSVQSGGWLSQASSPGNEVVGRALISLLSPTGTLFSSLLAVDRQDVVRFVFPTERLPDWVRRLLVLDNGLRILSQVSKLFNNRLKETSDGRVQMYLNVFEYYMFWFAYYAVCKDNGLVQEGLSVSKRGRIPSRQSQILSLGHWVSGFHYSFHPEASALHHNPYLQLLHLYLFHFVPFSCFKQSAGYFPRLQHLDNSNSDMHRADFLIHTLVEFWLIDDDPLPLPHSVCQSFGLPSFGVACIACVPSGSELTDALRILINHINSALKASFTTLSRGTNSTFSPDSSPTFRRGSVLCSDVRTSSSFSARLANSSFQFSTYSRLLQRPLYRFFFRAFRCWPEGSPITKVAHLIDVWLDYLQPWNTSGEGTFTTFPQKKGLEIRLSKSGTQSAGLNMYTEKWQGYVIGNYLFYTSLVVHFLEFALKFLHIDPEAILEMTSKVLNLLVASRDLLDLLRRIDLTYNKTLIGILQNSISSFSSELFSVIQEQIQEWEESSVASGKLVNDMPQLRNQLQLFSSSETGGHQNLQALLLQAGAEIQSLCGDSQSAIAIARSVDAIKNAGQIIFDSRLLQCSGDTPHLQNQQINTEIMASIALPHHTWRNVKYKGDWMRRPIESTEVAFLVRSLVKLSDSINRKLDLVLLDDKQHGRDGEAEQAFSMLQETGVGSEIMADPPAEVMEIGFSEFLGRMRNLSSDFCAAELAIIAKRFLWMIWSIVHQRLCVRGWRVNLRFLAKKPVAFFILLLIIWTLRNVLRYILSTFSILVTM